METVSETRFSEALKWMRKSWIDLGFMLIIASMIAWLIQILASEQPDKPSWMLVPLTVIYAILTLWMAAAAVLNAQAARRSAEAMEASVEEQRLSRWAAFAANLSFPKGYTFCRDEDESISIELGNLFRQPIIGLRVYVWFMDREQNDEHQIRYSSMMESDGIDVDQEKSSISVKLYPTNRPEPERVQLGDLALARFREVFQGQLPKSALCLLLYSHRADLSIQYFVYDLNEENCS